MRHLSVVLLCFAVGCGATNPNHGGGGSGGTGGGGTGGTGGGTGGGGTGGTGGGGGTGADGCSEAAKLIYVIDQDGTFSSFKPDQMNIANSVFTDLGKLSCSGAGGFYQPFSMSVDRSAKAWVEFVDQSPLNPGPNKLFNVTTTMPPTCTATNFMGNQMGFKEFGMGFVSNASGSTDETLFIAGGGSVGSASNLGTLDISTLMITKGGALTGDPELTGTGLGELWGFFPDLTAGANQAHVSKIDKSSGAESSQISLGSAAGQANAWAFAFYGGEFFVFLAKSNGATTIYHLDMNGLKDQLDTQTRHIVGAGVSTCAPTIPIG